MRFITLIILLSFSISGQESPNSKVNTSGPTSPKSGVDSESGDSKLQNTTTNQNEPTIFDELDLDKEFYVYYNYLNQPKSDQREENKTLHTNLLKSFKDEILIRDTPNCLKIMPDINVATVKIKNVSKDSIWMKKIRKEVGYINFTEYMYIIKYKNYLALILYQVDPRKHLISPYQVELIVNKEPPPRDSE